MVRFAGEERFPFPRSLVAEKLSDARFLAACAPGATLLAADERTATWSAPSPFSFAKTAIETTLAFRADRGLTAFVLANRLPGATLAVEGTFTFADAGLETRVAWSAEIVERTGLLKIVPIAVLRGQIEAELAKLWLGVHAKLAEEIA